jgi:putative tricarboxylic transport membrane protein
MTDHAHGAGGDGPPHRLVEFGVAAFTALFGLIVVVGSLQIGIGWGAEGPKSGFFPFYIALFILLASGVTALTALAGPGDRLFAEWSQLRQVLVVVVPTTIYVFMVPVIGMYVSSLLLIAAFMKFLGRYGWPLTLAVAIGVTIATYLMFEKWFLIPLPKGPIEDLLGL